MSNTETESTKKLPKLLEKEIVEINYKKLVDEKECLSKLDEERVDLVRDLFQTLKQEIMETPASSRTQYTCAFKGGLVEQTLRVVRNALLLREAYGVEDKVSISSLVFVCLVHDIGKIGTVRDGKMVPYYVFEQSEWHRTKLGQIYKINEELDGMSPLTLTLTLLSAFQIPVSAEEMQCLVSVLPQNKQTTPNDDTTPATHETWLTLILTQSIKSACMQGRNLMSPSVV